MDDDYGHSYEPDYHHSYEPDYHSHEPAYPSHEPDQPSHEPDHPSHEPDHHSHEPHHPSHHEEDMEEALNNIIINNIITDAMFNPPEHSSSSSSSSSGSARGDSHHRNLRNQGYVSELQEYNKDPSNRYAAIFLLVNAALGAGLVNFPKAFDQAGGITVALLVQLMLVCCVYVGLMVLARTSRNTRFGQSNDLQSTIATVCGEKGSNICSFLIALYCYGTCITFLIIIGDQFDRVLMTLVGPTFCHTWYMNRSFTTTASAIIFILPMCYSKKIDFLKYASSLGVVAVLYVVGLVVVQHFTGDYVPGPIKTGPNHWTDVFYVVPVICFGFQCHVSAVPIYSCMDDRSHSAFRCVVVATLVICATAYTLTGSYGYLTFGGSVSSDILEDYGKADSAVTVGIVAIAVKTVTTYPILQFCGREAVANMWEELTYDWFLESEKGRRIFISTIWFVSTVLVAVKSPDIGIVIDALGSLAAVFIFIFPGLCMMHNSLDDVLLSGTQKRRSIVFSVLFVALGAFIMGVVLMQTAEKIYNNEEDGPPLCSVI